MLTTLSSHRGTVETNKVLRNTFALLAGTLIPTVFGAFVGIAAGLPAIIAASPWLSLFGFLAIGFALLFAIHATADSPVAIPILGIFTFVVGAMMSGAISHTLALSNGASIVGLSFSGTIAILIGCSVYAMTTKRDFSSIGGYLWGALLAIIVVSLLNILFFKLAGLALLIAFISLVVFSLYLVYDVQQVVNGGETNYIIATTSIYLGLVNIFLDLLQILTSFGGAG